MREGESERGNICKIRGRKEEEKELEKGRKRAKEESKGKDRKRCEGRKGGGREREREKGCVQVTGKMGIQVRCVDRGRVGRG